jgi:hypothetical protein
MKSASGFDSRTLQLSKAVLDLAHETHTPVTVEICPQGRLCGRCGDESKVFVRESVCARCWSHEIFCSATATITGATRRIERNL